VLPFLAELSWLEDFFWFILNLTKEVISVPAMRKLSPIFFYFSSFDDLYLYMFHDRLYGPTMNELFIQVNAI
jgi:hypothetical protein